ncbi:LysR family transcriptional regulator [Microbulbifer sp. MLAF003]|uniref:LysR family transcriptional regulator n=1 Tax=Microbulbifer sp. MLAF003 TaxID=3032582 RepID=UPI0024AC8980|nr:LysR family transcriptional regulator [Microbulbifer sp. MLAF003]WHI50507.1 LysR family transcriptional regulator [Microbulbifer sp. MLAF003]
MIHNLNDMMVFLAVVETGSFTQAADRLGIPKANVSRKVARLEDRLSVKLLERSTRSQALTEAGRKYLSHCKRIEEEMMLAEAEVSEVLHVHRGPIKVGASITIGQKILKPALAIFLNHYPEIQMNLSLVNHRVDLIEEGFDVVVRVGEMGDSRLIARPLGHACRKIYASPDYLNKNGTPLNIKELVHHQWLFMNALGNESKIILQNGNRVFQQKIKPRFYSDDLSTIKQATIDSCGIAVLPDYMCFQEVKEGTLINLLPKWSMERIGIYALYPQNRAKIAKVGAFIEFLSDVFERKGLRF